MSYINSEMRKEKKKTELSESVTVVSADNSGSISKQTIKENEMKVSESRKAAEQNLKAKADLMKAKAYELFDEVGYKNDKDELCWERFTASIWQKYGKSRLYLTLKYGRNGKWKRDYSLYVDLTDGKIGNGIHGYSNSRERAVVRSIAEQISELVK